MYSREKRLKAIKLYLKYDKSEATVIRELGYPTRKLVVQWYKQYLAEQETGVVRDRYRRGPKYTPEQQQAAVSHYLEHGRNLSRTVRVLVQRFADEYANHLTATSSILYFQR